MSRVVRLLLIAAAMTCGLAAMVALHANARAGGTEIVLEMEPVDPRDLLLGHYVQLATPLHRLDTRDFGMSGEGWQAGDTVFVKVEPDAQGSWQPAALYRATARPALTGNGAVLVRGRVRSAYQATDFEDRQVIPQDGGEPYTIPERVEGSEHTVLSVVYNIERYYADQRTALELETMRNEDRLRLIVTVSGDGQAIIKGLEIDAERHLDTLF